MSFIYRCILVIALNASCLQSQDSWCEIASPSNVPFEAGLGISNVRMHFNNAAKGWMLVRKSSFNTEHWAQIYRTQDSGKTWNMNWQDLLGRYSREGSLRAIHMVDTLNGWIGGSKYYGNSDSAYPLVLHRAWIPGTVGINWHVQDTKLPANHAINGVWAFSADKALIATSKGIIARTFDAGETWKAIDTLEGNRSINEIFFIDSLYGWLYSSDLLYQTQDGGYSWMPIQYGTPFGIMGLFFFDRNHGWIGGEAGRIRATTDGGNTWFSQWSTTGSRIEDIEFISRNVGFAVGGGVSGNNGWLDSSRVLKTTDGGTTWRQTEHPRDAWISDIDLVDADNGYIVTGKYLYSYCGDELVSVLQNEDAQPCECTKSLYDFLGREVDAQASGMLLEYDPCARKARVVYR